ncbi:MAG TPA: SDR family NAD(P)-dependent oxidoreductase [Thermoanaerobaculia bacterium]|nr:SDR family NAD(P)-dependent oxidoreductase [Thermoanaerobaculia bacterium]
MEIAHITVLITGASSGIGRATAIEFARRGAKVVLAARRTSLLDEVAAECSKTGASTMTIATDVTKRSECDALIAAAGRVDILVNNAGFAVFDTIEDAHADDLESMMATNYLGTVYCTKAVLPQMLARRGGSIVMVASIAGLMGYAGMAGYCASKFAIVGFAEALRDEVIGRGVRVALVCPGTTETDFFQTAERTKMPGASRLIPGLSPERAARAIADAARDGRYRRILPLSAALFMRLKEFSPRIAHAVFRIVSRTLERR